MHRSVLVILVSLFLLTSSVLAQEKEKKPSFGFEPFCWYGKLSGDMKVTEVNIPGTKIDFISDLDMEKASYIPEAELWLRTGKRSKISLSYFEAEHKGREVLTTSFSYKGETYNINEDVSTTLKTKVGTLAHQFNFIQGKWVELGFLFGAKYIAFESALKSTAHARQKAAIGGSLPVVGLASRINFGKYVSWDTKVSGIGGDYADIGASLIDGWSKLTFNFNKNLGLGAGYRYFSLNGEVKDNEANLTLSGPAAFLTVRF